jgi:hypothetical protein
VTLPDLPWCLLNGTTTPDVSRASCNRAFAKPAGTGAWIGKFSPAPRKAFFEPAPTGRNGRAPCWLRTRAGLGEGLQVAWSGGHVGRGDCRLNRFRFPGVQRWKRRHRGIAMNIQHMWIVHLVVSGLVLAVLTYFFVLA